MLQLSHPTLRTRRRALGATRGTIAAGIGLRTYDVWEIETGEASDATVEHYNRWLTRIEAWPPEHRARQLSAARSGRRFRALDAGQRLSDV